MRKIQILFAKLLVIFISFNGAVQGKIHDKDLEQEFKNGMIMQASGQKNILNLILEAPVNSPVIIDREYLSEIMTHIVGIENWRIKIMNKFSRQSKANLKTCHPYLQLLARKILEGYDFSVLEGYRGKGDQNILFAKELTQLKYPDGMHNKRPSLAFDIAPFPLDWNDKKRFYHFAGFVQAEAKSLGIEIRWGGDWDRDNDLNDQHFMDLVHFELIL